ncbi:hypothetical protein BH09BAC1_BH09BAC1_02860 [soil metagenome]
MTTKFIAVWAFVMLLLPYAAYSQLLSGSELHAANGSTAAISYSKQTTQDDNDYTTAYTIIKNNTKLYEIELLNERDLKRITLSVTNLVSKNGSAQYCSYAAFECGLIAANSNFSIQLEDNPLEDFDWVVSFQDTGYTFPALHQIKPSSSQHHYQLEPLSKFLVNKHNTIVKAKQQEVEQQNQANQQLVNQQRIEDQRKSWQDSISRAVDSLAALNDELRRKIDSSLAANEKFLNMQRQEKYVRDYLPIDSFATAHRAAIVGLIEKFTAEYYFGKDEVKGFVFDMYLDIFLDTGGRIKSVKAINLNNNSSNSLTRNYNALNYVRLALEKNGPKLPVTTAMVMDKPLPVNSRAQVPFAVEYYTKNEKWVVNKNGTVNTTSGSPINTDLYKEFSKVYETPRSGKYTVEVGYLNINNKVTKHIVAITPN